MNITDPIRRHAQASPDAQAIIFPNGRTVSYRELDHTMNFLAAGVRGLGLAPGAIVGIETPRRYQDLCVRLALARLGIVAAPGYIPAGNLAICLIEGAIPDQPGVKFEPLDRYWPGDRARLTEAPTVPSHQDGAAVCAIFPTSGTTGIPKLVAVSHDVIAHRMATKLSALRLPNDARQLCTIGRGTAYGFLHRLAVLCNGGVVMMNSAMEQTERLACIDRHRVSHLVVAPISLQRLLTALPPGSVPPPSLRQIEVGGGILPDILYKIARQRLCANIVSQYGAAEAGPVAGATMLSLQGHPGAVGYVYPGVEVQAVDVDDNPLPPGTEGRLRVRSSGCVTGYFGNPAASAGVFRGGWVYPGDTGMVAPDGLLTVTGRESEVINQGGTKVNAKVIEALLLSVAGIAEAAAFGAPDAFGVTRIYAAIVPNGPVNMAAVEAVCRERLKHYAPTSILRLGALPRNEAGKVLLDVLRKSVMAGPRGPGDRQAAP